MKQMMLTLMLGLTLSCAHAEDGTTVMELPWDSPSALKVPNSEITHPDQGPPVLTISVADSSKIPNGYSHYYATLFRIQSPKITTSTYTLTGEVAYQNLGNNSAIQLMASYREVGLTGMQTGDSAGLAASLDGTSDFRPFALTIRHPTSDKLEQLEINLNLFGHLLPGGTKPSDFPVTISLRNLKLVEYPDPPPPPPPAPVAETLAAPAPAAPAPSPGLDWPSFWIGVTACVLMLLALAQVLLLVRRIKQARHDKEMRRIASLDR